MSSYLDHFKEAYRQSTLEFGVADIFTDDSVNVAKRDGAFVLLMNLATFGKDGDQSLLKVSNEDKRSIGW